MFWITQDSRGFMWFCTRNGLNRWDGQEVRTFVPDHSDPGAISGSVIVIAFEDSRGDLWFGSEGGLSRFDSSTRPSQALYSVHRDTFRYISRQ